MAGLARKISGIYEAISSDIFAFAAELNFTPTFQQAQLFDAINRRVPRIACKSGQGPGKTTASVIVGLFRALQGVDAMTVVTAPTMRQCREVWIAEANRVMDRCTSKWLKKFIRVTKTKVEIAGRAEWGIKTVTANKEENAQGYHDPNMTVICEEASGIPREIITQFKGTLSNPNSLLLLIGNPNSRDCAFFDCFTTQRRSWHTMTWNAEETPESEWFSHQRNRDLEAEFGRDSDVYKIRVLGQFPDTDPNCVINAEAVDACTEQANLLACVRMSPGVKQFGIDFARYGGDDNTIFQRSGNAIVDWKRYSHTDPSLVVDEAFAMQARSAWSDGECTYIADAGGMGQGIVHRFYQAGKNVMEFHNGGSATDQQYDNKITEAWFGLARLIKARHVNMPPDQQLIKQLSTRRYFTTRKGKLIVESKDEFMKRGNQSPDRADGCVMAMYDEENVKGNIASLKRKHQNLGIKVRQ